MHLFISEFIFSITCDFPFNPASDAWHVASRTTEFNNIAIKMEYTVP